MLGVFDSGIGGLTVLKEIKKISPNLDVVYFGDTKNAPYGLRGQKELKKLTLDGIKILLDNGANNVLSACNSISVFMLPNDFHGFGVMEMISPIVGRFKKNKNEKMLVIATPATIGSGIYQKKFDEVEIEIETLAIKDLAGVIEFGEKGNKIKEIIHNGLLQIKGVGFNKAILCCTHYPFVIDDFKDAFAEINKNIEVIDPARIVAEKVAIKFGKEKGVGKLKFLISKESENFRKTVADNFSDCDYTIEIV